MNEQKINNQQRKEINKEKEELYRLILNHIRDVYAQQVGSDNDFFYDKIRKLSVLVELWSRDMDLLHFKNILAPTIVAFLVGVFAVEGMSLESFSASGLIGISGLLYYLNLYTSVRETASRKTDQLSEFLDYFEKIGINYSLLEQYLGFNSQESGVVSKYERKYQIAKLLIEGVNHARQVPDTRLSQQLHAGFFTSID